jgi:hypothetical protein
MAVSWILVPSLVSLTDEFNALAPKRQKTSDGSIGDPRHAQSSSDHNPDETGKTPSEDADRRNEVHAKDVDKDLNRAGWTMDRATRIIIERHRSGLDNRLQNVIYKRRIYSRTWGWTAREYTGSNAHNEHAHFSARYTTAQENDTRPWGLLLAAAPPAKPREVNYVDLNGKLPELVRGDNDDTVPGGTTWVRRAQALLAYLAGYDGKLDGGYGPKMQAAVKKLMASDPARSSKDGSKVGEAEWRRLFGLWKPAAK